MIINWILLIISISCIVLISSFLTNLVSKNNETQNKLFFPLFLYLIPAILVGILGFIGCLYPFVILGALLLFSILVVITIFKNKNLSINLPTLYFGHDLFSLLPYGLIFFYFLKSSLGGCWISLDDSTYHAAIPALWVKFNSFYVPQLTYQSGFPLNGSLFSTFFMVFLKNEYLASISELLLIFISLGCVELLENSKESRFLYQCLICLFFFMTDAEQYLMGFSDSDILPGVFFLVIYTLVKTGNRAKSFLFLSAVLLGFNIGVKLTNLIYGLPFFYLIFKNFKTRNEVFVALLLCCFFSSPWYIKNYFSYLNPIYPFSKFGFEGIINNELSVISSIKGIWSNLSLNEKQNMLFGFLGWKKFSFIVPIISFSLFLSGLLFGSKEKELLIFKTLSMASLCLFILSFVGAPFSGLNESLGLNINSSRYLLPFYFYVLFIDVQFLDKFLKRNHIIFIGLLIAFFIFSPRYLDKKIYIALFAAALFVFTAKRFSKVKFNFTFLIMIMIPIVGFYSSNKIYRSKVNSIWYSNYIDKIKSAKKISIYNGFIFRSFYLMGKDFIHEPVRLDYFGSDKIDLNNNEIRKNYIYSSFAPKTDIGFCETFVDNLQKSNVDILIINNSPDGQIPAQNCAKLIDRFSVVESNNNGLIYQIKI